MDFVTSFVFGAPGQSNLKTLGKAGLVAYGLCVATSGLVGGLRGMGEFMWPAKSVARKRIKNPQLKSFEGVYNSACAGARFVKEVGGGALMGAATMAVAPIIVPYVALTECEAEKIKSNL